ncbi:bacillithiol biosynthesis cysteine-adding enzyme BshC [bacterium]|nr:bacillithiol biosynthesis cysteine-adding enzyme BshC [bacterium]
MRSHNLRTPGASKLFTDYIENFERVAEFYNGDYREPIDFVGRSDFIKSRNLPIARLVPILKEQNQQFGCGISTLEKIDLLLERRASAVVTGQQTGLFTGPLLTIYKALTTIKLAVRLNRTCEGCYVPIFWLASDDHDFREVNHINLLNKNNQVSQLTYAGYDADRRTPVSAIEVNAQISSVLELLESATHPSGFKSTVLDLLAAVYEPGAGFSKAFGMLLTHLFKSFGLILIDASDPRIKAFGASIFKEEIARKSPSTNAAQETSKRLLDLGYHNQVNVQSNVLNLFFVDGERQTIESRESIFSLKGSDREFTLDELLKKLQDQPDSFSPNVLLRPIFQDSLLPTVAYVAGPAEIAYYAQMKGVFDSFELTMPIIYPRKRITLLEPKIEKVLDSYDLSVSDLWGNEDHLIKQIVKAKLPQTLEKRIENASLCVNKNLQALEDVVVEFEPTLVNTMENVKGRISGQMEVLEKKILQAYKKRNEVIHLQIKKAKNNLYPTNEAQERILNIVPFLIKHGFGFVDQLYEAMNISDFDHQVIRI